MAQGLTHPPSCCDVKTCAEMAHTLLILAEKSPATGLPHRGHRYVARRSKLMRERIKHGVICNASFLEPSLLIFRGCLYS